mmetsp:Transcript_11265/g.25638  ORF Transcript_11265/g.25638 Transcript_11265/m.25638 type:complete len:203 (-) Transcript_11265:173-781(-)
MADNLPDGCEARPCLGVKSPADDRVILNSRLLAASTDGDLQGIRRAIGSGADIETRKPMVIRPRCMKVPEEAADDPDDLPPVLGLGQDCAPSKHILNQKVLVAPNTGLTPLMRAAKEGRAKAVALLLDLGAAPHSKDEDGMTALHFAAAAACHESCEALLRAGADPLKLDDSKKDAYASLPPESIATRRDQAEWKSLLRSRG